MSDESLDHDATQVDQNQQPDVVELGNRYNNEAEPEPQPLTRLQLRHLVDESREIVEALEKEHEEDLARHLFASFLTRTNREAAKLPPFPSPRWYTWPVYDRKLEQQDSDDPRPHRVMPAVDHTFTTPNTPRETPSAVQPGVASASGSGSNVDRGAKQLLLYELDATFQRVIHKRIHRHGASQNSHGDNESAVPVVSDDWGMPQQMRTRVFEMVDRVLDETATQLPRLGASRNQVSWKEILQRDAAVGNAAKRCRKLFVERIDKHSKQAVAATTTRVRRLPADHFLYMNLMTNRDDFAGEMLGRGKLHKRLRRALQRKMKQATLQGQVWADGNEAARCKSDRQLLPGLLVAQDADDGSYTGYEEFRRQFKLLKREDKFERRMERRRRGHRRPKNRPLKYIDRAMNAHAAAQRAFTKHRAVDALELVNGDGQVHVSSSDEQEEQQADAGGGDGDGDGDDNHSQSNS